MTDLRQTPKEFIKSPNMEYVYITYQTGKNFFQLKTKKKKDRQFYTNERELIILMNLQKLEKSYGVEKTKSPDDEKMVQLDLVYDLTCLQTFVQSVSESLDGPLGQQFFDDRVDFLTNLIFYIWKTYLKQ